MIGHLGSRVSALLDGHLDPVEEERAWGHVHTCPACHDLVEREGWVKRRLAGAYGGVPGASEHLKGSLRDPVGAADGSSAYAAPGESPHPAPGIGGAGRSRHRRAVLAVGGGAAGAAVVGVLVLGAAPASAPTLDRRAPLSQFTPPSGPALSGFSPAVDRGPRPLRAPR